MWVDVTAGFGSKWKRFFQELQEHQDLDPANRSHRWLLHFLFLGPLNQDAQDWRQAWNSHKLSLKGERNSSPAEKFLFGMAQNGAVGLEEDLGTSPEEYGIDWAEMELPTIIDHYLRRNYPDDQNDGNPFKSQAPKTFNHLTMEDEECPLSSPQLQGLVGHLELNCSMQSRNMDERVQIWKVALEYLVSL